MTLPFTFMLHGTSKPIIKHYCVKVWDLKSMRCVNTLKGHTFDVNSLELMSNGQLLSASSDKTIKLW